MKMRNDTIKAVNKNEFLSVVLCNSDKKSSQEFKAVLNEIKDIKVIPGPGDFSETFDFIKETNPSVVIINTYPSEEEAFTLAKSISETLPDTNLFLTSPDSESAVVIRAMRVGAKEFFTQPINPKELISALDKIKFLSTDAQISEGEILTFFGVKGGIGTTTILTNVADALAKHTSKDQDIIVVDLNLQFGSVGLMLDTKSKYSIIDIARNIENIDLKLLKSSLSKNANGVYVLSAPSRIEDAEKITVNDIHLVLRFL